MRVAIELPSGRAVQLQTEAKRLGVSVEDLARAAVTDLLAAPDAAFQAAAKLVDASGGADGLQGLAMNHPFVDGSERIAHAAMAVFLELNGFTFPRLNPNAARLTVPTVPRRARSVLPPGAGTRRPA
jgi:prophage maintenance system killer protein